MESPTLRWHGWPWLIATLCAGLLIYRRPDAVLDPGFWAEDGKYFFADAYQLGWRSLFANFANYPTLFMRLAAYCATFFPDAWAPAVFNAFAFANHMAVIAYLFSDRVPLRWKPMLALFSVLAPCLAAQPLFNLTNSQWQSAQLLLLWIVSTDPATRRQNIFDTILLLLTGLTGPFLVLFFPLIAGRWYLRKSPASGLFLGLAGALLAIQIAMMVLLPTYGLRQLGFDNTSGFDPANPIWRGVFGDSIAGVLLLGVNAPLYLANSTLMTLASAALYVFLTWDAMKRRDMAQLALLYASLIILIAASVHWRGHPEGVIQSSRYHYLQRVFFYWALIQSTSAGFALRLPLRILAAWALLVSFPHAQSWGPLNYAWPRASRLLEMEGDLVLPCMQPDWFVRVRNAAPRGKSLQHEEMLPPGQNVVLKFEDGAKREKIMRFQKPLKGFGVTLRYSAQASATDSSELKVSIGRPGKTTVEHPISLLLKADGQIHRMTFYTGGDIEGWILDAPPELSEVVLHQVTLLR